jgi:hypothetical protein
MDTNANTLGEYEEAGAWRIGIMCQSCCNSFALTYASREQLNHVVRQLFRIPNRTTLHRRLKS